MAVGVSVRGASVTCEAGAEAAAPVGEATPLTAVVPLE